MPLPRRHSDEGRAAFVQRCLESDVMKREFPDPDQRLAVCQGQADLPAAGRIDLLCTPGNITLEALAAGTEAEAIPRFTMVAYTGEPMHVQGWRYPVVVDLEGLSIPSQRRPVRFGHSMYAGVGHTERIAVEAGRLIAEGVVSRETPAAREVVASGKRGFPWQASIGAQVTQAEFVRAGKSVTVNGRTFDGPLYVARRTVLGEISFVDLGADIHTTVAIAAGRGCRPEAEGWSKDTEESVMEDDRHTAEQEARPEAAGTEAQAGGTEADASGLQSAASSLRAQALAETKRIAAIRRICGSKFPQIEEQAIAEGWNEEKTELEKLRASRPKAPAVHVSSRSEERRVGKECRSRWSPYH